MRANQGDYSSLFANDQAYTAYLDRLEMNGTWCGELEIRALSNLYQVNVRVYYVEGSRVAVLNYGE